MHFPCRASCRLASWTRASRPPVVLAVAALLAAGPSSLVAQDPAPTIPGSAVLSRGPLQVDTIPILCRDTERPDLGFVTEVGDPEWTPAVDLRMEPVAGDSLRVVFDDGSETYDRTIPLGTPTTGMFYASVNLVPWDTGRGVDMTFAASCTERLARGGDG